MDIGTQYKKDDSFKAKARFHQSDYRANILKVDYYEFGNRLTNKDGESLINYYDKLNCRSSLKQRYPAYSKERDSDMLRSEHIPFNLLAPLDTNHSLAINIINEAFGLNITSIEFISLEYAPKPRKSFLNDGTSFDTYIQAKLPDDKIIGIGIEVKYTEKSYPIGKSEKMKVQDKNSTYWQTARNSNDFTDSENSILSTDPLRQIWRNHLLGLSMKQQGLIDEFKSVTLFPDGNDHFHKELPIYTALLNNQSKKDIISCTFEKFISAIDGSVEFEEWKFWLTKRYIF